MTDCRIRSFNRFALITLIALVLTPAETGYAQDDSSWIRDQARERPQPASAGEPTDIRPDTYQDRSDRDLDRPDDETFSEGEITSAGHQFFGSISRSLAGAIEHAFRRRGRPNGYILGEEAGGAFIAGLRYGEGTLFTKNAGQHKVFWQGPSVGFDIGAEGSRTMVLVYNLREIREIYSMYGGIAGSAYVIGGIGLTYMARDHVTLARIRSGIGLRLGANVGYLKYTRRPKWNPF